MLAMPGDYHQLLDATIQHLRELKNRGTRFVAISPASLAGLTSLKEKPRAPAAKKAVAPAQQKISPVQTQVAAPVPAPPAEKPVEMTFSLGLPGETPAAPPPPLGPEAKAAAFADLRERAMACDSLRQ